MSSHSTVFVVDDDEGVALSLRALIESVGLTVETFRNGQAFLDQLGVGRPGCLVLDVRMPGMSGLQLQEILKERGFHIPVIFISSHGDVRMAVRAVQAGALDFIEKPFHDQHLLDCIQRALILDASRRLNADEHAALAVRIESLTPREREVMDLVVQGKSSKAIAGALDISSKTVEFHRARLMQKMHASSAPDLVRRVLTGRITVSP